MALKIAVKGKAEAGMLEAVHRRCLRIELFGSIAGELDFYRMHVSLTLRKRTSDFQPSL
jgi:hypothetical protein